MVIRVLPASKGGIYANTGGSSYLVTYLEHEVRQEKQADNAIFFDQSREGISAGDVQKQIDANVTGLQKGKPRFHSLVIAPSQDELRALNDKPEKLIKYTRQVMENYAANFTQRRKQPLPSGDLVWFATLHRSRHYSGLDDAVQTGTAQLRQPKEGEQTHIHVIVSARDKTMSRSLHPDAGRSQFNYRDWLRQNQTDFERMFGFKQTVSEGQHQQRLEKQINRLSRGGVPLDQEKMRSLGRYYAYSSAFWKGMSQVERGVKQGTIFTANQAYERLKHAAEPIPNQSRPVPRGRALQPIVPPARATSAQSQDIPKSAVEAATATSPAPPSDPQGGSPQQPGAARIETSRSRPINQAANSLTRTDLGPLLKTLTFESVPQTGEHALHQDDDYRRKLKRRR